VELSGKIAFVTGAGSGIGKAAALRLAAAGADVIVASRTAKEVEATAEAIEGTGRRSLALVLDVADDKAMKAAFTAIKREFGRLDIVFANAGINGVWAPLADLKPREWQQTIDINLGGTFLTLHYAIPLMRKIGGSVVITSSINGNRTFTSGGAAAYATTKAGQVALCKMAALELAKHKIRVNVICPGAIGTEIDENTEKRNAKAAAEPAAYPEGTVPLTDGVPGTAADCAELVQFLASDRSRHITGTPIYIDGGQSLMV
jgi:NAD(P)-dependent dehydrogenase (short-subunit alcohol dehydrogenase family)